MFFPSVEKGTGTDFHVPINVRVVLLVIGHLFLNIGPVVSFFSDFPLQRTNQFRVSDIYKYVLNIGKCLVQVGYLVKHLSGGRSNSSAYSTCDTPSLNCKTTIPKGDEPKPGSMPRLFWAYLLTVLYFCPNSMALSISYVWKVLPVIPRS